MAKVKEVSSYSGSAWGTAVPIGANATNIDMATNPTDYDSSSTETSTTLIGTNDVKVISSDTDLTAWGKFNRFRKRVSNAISNLSLIAIQSTTPTKGEKLWLDTSGSGLMIPQVNDSIASATDTWSSNKIGNQINAIENGLAIIVEGDICTTAVPAGGYAYIKNNTHGLAEGLYRNKTTSAFPTTGGTANSTVFEYVGAGGLNALNDKLEFTDVSSNISSQVGTFNIKQAYTKLGVAYLIFELKLTHNVNSGYELLTGIPRPIITYINFWGHVSSTPFAMYTEDTKIITISTATSGKTISANVSYPIY